MPILKLSWTLLPFSKEDRTCIQQTFPAIWWQDEGRDCRFIAGPRNQKSNDNIQWAGKTNETQVWQIAKQNSEAKTPEGDWNEGHICTHKTPLPQQITSNAAGRNTYYCRFHFTCGKHDGVNVRSCEKSFNRFPEIWVQQNSAATEALPPQGTKRNKKRRLNEENVNPEESIVLHPTPWSLSKEQKKTADARAASITYSIAHSISPGPHFSKFFFKHSFNWITIMYL